MRNGIALCFWIFCIAQTACSQIATGTIVVFALIPDKAVIAADSRGGFVKGGPADDTYCKIAAFGNQVIFAVAGSALYLSSGVNDPIPSWSAIGVAKNVHKAGSHAVRASSKINTIADAWAKEMQANWTNLYTKHPDLVITAADKGKGLLTSGIFIGARTGRMA